MSETLTLLQLQQLPHPHPHFVLSGFPSLILAILSPLPHLPHPNHPAASSTRDPARASSASLPVPLHLLQRRRTPPPPTPSVAYGSGAVSKSGGLRGSAASRLRQRHGLGERRVFRTARDALTYEPGGWRISNSTRRRISSQSCGVGTLLGAAWICADGRTAATFRHSDPDAGTRRRWRLLSSSPARRSPSSADAGPFLLLERRGDGARRRPPLSLSLLSREPTTAEDERGDPWCCWRTTTFACKMSSFTFAQKLFLKVKMGVLAGVSLSKLCAILKLYS
jgi:hypothetical protein